LEFKHIEYDIIIKSKRFKEKLPLGYVFGTTFGFIKMIKLKEMSVQSTKERKDTDRKRIKTNNTPSGKCSKSYQLNNGVDFFVYIYSIYLAKKIIQVESF
jgi:hypothetical protein